jgi:hypothetical protein
MYVQFDGLAVMAASWKGGEGDRPGNCPRRHCLSCAKLEATDPNDSRQRRPEREHRIYNTPRRAREKYSIREGRLAVQPSSMLNCMLRTYPVANKLVAFVTHANGLKRVGCRQDRGAKLSPCRTLPELQGRHGTWRQRGLQGEGGAR